MARGLFSSPVARAAERDSRVTYVDLNAGHADDAGYLERIDDVAGATGDQPVANEDGSVHVVQNGELYNHDAVRDDLRRRGHSFRSRCDERKVG